MKVLIISHNVISTTNNMGKTLLSLFSTFKKEELCQLYVYPSLPDVDVCNSYYRVTDKDVLKSIIKFKLPGGELDSSSLDFTSSALFEEECDAVIYNNTRNSSSLRRLLRDCMWKMARWNNPGLKAWIEKEKPECIFLAPGYAKFIYDIALTISVEYQIPIFTYICDDYYFVKKPEHLIDKVQLSLLQKKMNHLMEHSKHVIGICDEISELYAEKFDVPATTIMTGTAYSQAREAKRNNDPKCISYFGNVRCNRYVSLAEIGTVLDQINHENNTDYSLKIYTAEKDIDILKCFNGIDSIKLMPFVSGIEFENELFSSDILLHVEAFDEESMDLVKHSVSTKIADSLASGIPLFTYGPSEIASVKYLLTNNIACVITNKFELKLKLQEYLGDDELRYRTAKNAIALANDNHNLIVSSEKLFDILDSN